jgi:hypothetical protein
VDDCAANLLARPVLTSCAEHRRLLMRQQRVHSPKCLLERQHRFSASEYNWMLAGICRTGTSTTLHLVGRVEDHVRDMAASRQQEWADSGKLVPSQLIHGLQWTCHTQLRWNCHTQLRLTSPYLVYKHAWRSSCKPHTRIPQEFYRRAQACCSFWHALDVQQEPFSSPPGVRICCWSSPSW